MAAPAISQVILAAALITIIFTVQVFYFYVVDNVSNEMLKRELKELTDYVADTIVNLYFLVNSTSTNPSLEKTLRLPLDVGGASYTLNVTYDGSSKIAQNVKASIQGKTWLTTSSWLPPGLKVNATKTQTIEASGKTVVAGCERVSSNVYVWIAYKG